MHKDTRGVKNGYDTIRGIWMIRRLICMGKEGTLILFILGHIELYLLMINYDSNSCQKVLDARMYLMDCILSRDLVSETTVNRQYVFSLFLSLSLSLSLSLALFFSSFSRPLSSVSHTTPISHPIYLYL